MISVLRNRLEMIVRDQADQKFPHRLTLRLAGESIPQYNFRCHLVAAQAAKTRFKGAIGVVETVIIYPKCVVGHYVNLMEDGTMCDFTLGLDSASEDVRLVRYVHPDEYCAADVDVNDLLRNLKKKLCEDIPTFYKPFYNPFDLC